jgi:RimJ/RimL family protein N-acetyltransferase
MISLVPMTEAEITKFNEESIIDYAESQVKAGVWQQDDALQKSRALFERPLPSDMAAEGNYFYAIKDESLSRTVGSINLIMGGGKYDPIAFIAYLIIGEPYRHRGYGTQTMQAIEIKATELGASRIALHVFSHNDAAKKLYEKMGYNITGYNMNKPLNSDI